MGYGVIGSPTVSGSVSLGSSPGTPARKQDLLISAPQHSSTAPSSSGPGRRPLTAVARVRIPSGLREREPPAHQVRGLSASAGAAPSGPRPTRRCARRRRCQRRHVPGLRVGRPGPGRTAGGKHRGVTAGRRRSHPHRLLRAAPHRASIRRATERGEPRRIVHNRTLSTGIAALPTWNARGARRASTSS